MSDHKPLSASMMEMTVSELCDQGIAALAALYGECPEEDYDPDCIACRASVLIRDMRGLRDGLPWEPLP